MTMNAILEKSVNPLFVSALQMTSNNVLQENLVCLEMLIELACSKNTDKHPHLVVAPEYFCDIGGDKLALAQNHETEIKEKLTQLAQKYQIYFVAGTIPTLPKSDVKQQKEKQINKVYNTCFTFNPDGKIIGTYHKHHLFRFVNVKNPQESYDESTVLLAGKGDDENIHAVDTPFGKIGIGICVDLRFPQFFQKLRNQGVSLFVLPSAFTHTTGSAHWEVLLRSRSIENQAFMVASNQGGIHFNGRHTFGNSMIINPWGSVLKQMNEEVGVIQTLINLEEATAIRESLPLCG
jgi:predicted amidohydrolase